MPKRMTVSAKKPIVADETVGPELELDSASIDDELIAADNAELSEAVAANSAAPAESGLEAGAEVSSATEAEVGESPEPSVSPATTAPIRRVPVQPLQSARFSNGYRPSGPTRSGGNGHNGNSAPQYTQAPQPATEFKMTKVVGVLDINREGHGIVRVGFSDGDFDAFLPSNMIRRYGLLQGDAIEAQARLSKDNDRYPGIVQIDQINGEPVSNWPKRDRVKFQKLTPVYPNAQIKLEIGDEPLALRMIDIVAPIGKGQRSLIVSPPKAGKTTLLKDIATGIAANHPEVHIMAVLVGERPEEVTDIRRHLDSITKNKGETAASNFDESAKDQCRVAELALERAKRMVEAGRDVVILLDSITRLARAYNLAMPTSGRTLSGGFDPAALFPPKKFFGAARNFEVPGSLTIIGTALVDTGSRMDDLVYEEFKGTGNQEVHLVRRLAERRVFPAIDVQKSGTRRDDLLIEPITYQSISTLHRMLDMIDKDERTDTLIAQMRRFKTNKEFLASLKQG